MKNPKTFMMRIRRNLFEVALETGGTNKMSLPFRHLNKACKIIESLITENKSLHAQIKRLETGYLETGKEK